jgi:hypothetical protein
MSRSLTCRAVCLLAVGACSLLLSAGCRPAESIRSYTIPKENEASPVASNRQASRPPDGPPTHRMLAVIVPAGDKAWSFKVVGTIEEIESAQESIVAFLETLSPPAEGGQLSWQLPEGWQQSPGTGMRAATITIPSAGGLEMSVVTFDWRGDATNNLLANVNRWRGQMHLPPIGPAELSKVARQVADGPVTIVDLTGHWQEGPMSMSIPGANTSAPAAPPLALPLSMKAPVGWQAIPASGLRKAAFLVEENGGRAEVTVMDFPATAPAIAEPKANIDRWRKELDLGPISQDEIGTVSREIEIDGRPGLLVELESAAGAAKPRATLAAMVTYEGVVWFVKMMGDKDVVENQADNFQKLLDTIRFSSS